MAKSRLKVTIVADGQKQVFSGTGEPAALVCAFRAWLELGAQVEMAEGADALDREVRGLEQQLVRVKFADREVVYGSEAEARAHLERLRGDLARGVRTAASLVVEADEAMGVAVGPDEPAQVMSVPGLGVEEHRVTFAVSEVLEQNEAVLPAGTGGVHTGMTKREVQGRAFDAIRETAVIGELRREVFFEGSTDWYDFDRIRAVVNAPIDIIRRVLEHMVRVGQAKSRPRNGRTEWSRA